jgi:hypothetical protein
MSYVMSDWCGRQWRAVQRTPPTKMWSERKPWYIQTCLRISERSTKQPFAKKHALVVGLSNKEVNDAW